MSVPRFRLENLSATAPLWDQNHPTVQTLHCHLPQAVAVYLMGPFNRWSTTATPMSRNGLEHWVAELDSQVPLASACLFVYEQGRRHGRIVRIESCQALQTGAGVTGDAPPVGALANQPAPLRLTRPAHC